MQSPEVDVTVVCQPGEEGIRHISTHPNLDRLPPRFVGSIIIVVITSAAAGSDSIMLIRLRSALFPFQRDGIEFVIGLRGRAMIADEVCLMIL